MPPTIASVMSRGRRTSADKVAASLKPPKANMTNTIACPNAAAPNGCGTGVGVSGGVPVAIRLAAATLSTSSASTSALTSTIWPLVDRLTPARLNPVSTTIASPATPPRASPESGTSSAR